MLRPFYTLHDEQFSLHCTTHCNIPHTCYSTDRSLPTYSPHSLTTPTFTPTLCVLQKIYTKKDIPLHLHVFHTKKTKGQTWEQVKLSDIAYIVRNCGAKWCPSSRPKLSFVKGAVSTQIVQRSKCFRAITEAHDVPRNFRIL